MTPFDLNGTFLDLAPLWVWKHVEIALGTFIFIACIAQRLIDSKFRSRRRRCGWFLMTGQAGIVLQAIMGMSAIFDGMSDFPNPRPIAILNMMAIVLIQISVLGPAVERWLVSWWVFWRSR